jgi:RNA polymerase sigma factor (sigma-70 family)
MQVTDSHYADPPLVGEALLEQLRGRLRELGPELRTGDLSGMLGVLEQPGRAPESVRDAVSTRLMEAFRLGSGRGAFGLLYELNADHLLVQVASRLRRYASKADPRDVLQEVFFNIYRYPHRFNAEREDAFRVWSAMIVRNTVLKHLRAQGHGGRAEIAIEDLSGEPEVSASSPLHSVVERESRKECERVYLTYLHLYLRFYTMLSERERQALQLVEVEERSYREAAEALGIKLENLKMVIFRARRKIHRSMRRVFDGLSPDCRPARGPRGAGSDAESSRIGGETEGEADQREVDAHGL